MDLRIGEGIDRHPLDIGSLPELVDPIDALLEVLEPKPTRPEHVAFAPRADAAVVGELCKAGDDILEIGAAAQVVGRVAPGAQGRQQDGHEQADDAHDDEQLDERERGVMSPLVEIRDVS